MNKTIEILWKEALKNSDVIEDLSYAKRVFFNKTEQEIDEAFSRNVIERADELRFMPDNLFTVYFPHFNRYVIEALYDNFDASMVADAYLRILEEKLNDQVVFNEELKGQIIVVIDYFKSNMTLFNCDTEVYGDLRPRIELVVNLLSKQK